MNEVPAPVMAADVDATRPMVLVVDDEPAFTDTVVEILNRNGYVAIASNDAEDALETALLIPPELAITDVGTPGSSGIALAIALKSKLPDCKVMVLAEHDRAADLPELELRAELELLKQVSNCLKRR